VAANVMSRRNILVLIVALVSGCSLLGACVEQGIPLISYK
jgi:hypothetical protein